MYEFTEKAVQKINVEMQKNPSDVYTEIIGHYVIDRCAEEVVAAKVAADNKTLSGAMQAVLAAAQKAKHGNMAVLTPEPVFDAVDAYFVIAKNEAVRRNALATACGAAAPVKPEKTHMAVDLADFL